MTAMSAVDDDYLRELDGLLSAARSDSSLFDAIVNAPFYDRAKATVLGLGISVLLLVNPKTKDIERIALSRTELAKGTIDITTKPFRSIRVPLSYKGNLVAEAIRSGRYQQTSDWQYLFAPDLSPDEAKLNQAGGGIACSFIYPLVGARNGGAMIFSYFINLNQIGPRQKNFMQRYSRLVTKALKK